MKQKKRATVNQRQQDFYDTKKKNLPTKMWSFIRNGVLNRIKKDVGIEKDIYELHMRWFGNLSEKKVLDLGCYAGNSLSIYLAQNSRSYLGIDLSGKGIGNLDRRLKKIPGAKAEVRDFLSRDFKEENFDLIYAYGVLHHFKDVDELIVRLQEKLKFGGIIVSHDPLQTSLPMKIIRGIYRPFQSDREWEWPFTKKTYYQFEEAFEVKERRAVLGKSKWAAFLPLLPLSEKRKIERAKAWHKEDWERSRKSDAYMFNCMHLSLLMTKRS